MNIFAPSPDPVLSARALADAHVVKMPIETAQILSTVLRMAGVDDPALYRATHPNHPCTRWAGSSWEAARWLVQHGVALCYEYSLRYGRHHKSRDVIWTADEHIHVLPDVLVLPVFPQVMDNAHKGDDPHAAYRSMLRAKYAQWAANGRPARYTRTAPPDWLDGVEVRRINPDL